MIGIGIADSLGVNLSGLNPATKSFITSAGISDASTVTTINNLVNGLQASGLWSKMKAVYPFVTDNRNLLSYTNTLTQTSYWNQVSVTLTSGQTDPTGGTNATRIVGTGAASLYGLISLTAGATYTLSCYVKSTSGSNQTFRIYANGGSPFSPNLTATSTWQQVTLTFTAIAGTNSFGITRDSSTNNFDILAYGIQMELGSTATTYQPIATTQQAYIANQFKYNLKDPRDADAAFRLVFNGGWTFANTGATPNGVNGYADTKLSPFLAMSDYSQHLSMYSRTQNSSVNGVNIGCYLAANNAELNLYQYYASASIKGGSAYEYPTYAATFNNTNTLGFQVVSRTSNNALKLHFNGSLLATNTNTETKTRPNLNVYLGASNWSTTGAAQYTPHQNAFSTIGDGLTDDDATNLYYYTQVFQTSLGRQIGSPAYALPNTYDANAKLYLSAIGSTTNNTFNNAINTFITGLKADGIYSKMKAVYPFATDNVNLAGYSEDITNITGWNSVTMTRTANTTVAPNGTLTADTFTTVSNGNNAVWNLGWIAGNGQTFTNSIYLKYNNAQWVTLEIWEGSGQNGIRLWVDIQNGVLGTANATVGTFLTSSILNVGNGWYRVSLTGIMPGTNNAILVVRHVDGNGAYNFTAVSGLSTYCWGAQNEVGNLTTYQPQLGSAQSYFANQFKYNMINPQDDDTAFRLVFNGGWTHSPQGALPNGVNAYADTKLNPTTALTNYNAHASTYNRIDSNNSSWEIGLSGSTSGYLNEFLLSGKVTNQSVSGLYDYNGLTNGEVRVAATSAVGYFQNSITSNTSQKLYKNGAQIGVNTNINTSTPANGNIYLAAVNDINTTAIAFSNVQTAFSSIGNGLSDAESANLFVRVETLNQALARQVVVPIVSDPDAQAFLNNAVITDPTQAAAINNLVIGLKADGLWTKMKAIYPFVGGTATTHKYNLKDPRDLDAAYRLVFNGGWTHDVNGATPNGVNGYADPKLNLNTISSGIAHMSFYSRTDSNTGYEWGSIDGWPTTFICTKAGGSFSSGYDGQQYFSYANTDGRGFYMSQKDSLTVNSGYKNGVKVTTTTGTTSYASGKAVYLARYETIYGTKQSAFATIGALLNDTEATALYTRVQNYNTQLSRQV